MAPLLLATMALAAPLSDDGLVEILTVSEVAGDARAVEVTLIALDTKGQPMKDLRLTSRASRGSASGWAEVVPGIYSFTFVPPHLSEPMDVNVAINGRTPDKKLVNSSAMILVLAPWPQKLEVKSVPDHLVVGQRHDAMVTATGGDLGTWVRATTNVGTADKPLALGGGVHKVHLGANAKSTSPYVAVVGVHDEGATGPAYGWVTLPVSITRPYTITAGVEEVVMLRVGDREFGPMQGGPKGAVIVAEVPPGVAKGTVVRVDPAGKVREEPLDLGIVEGPRVGFMPLPRNVPAGVPVPVALLHVDAKGKPDGTAKLVVKASHGAATEAKLKEGGRYELTWTATDVPQATPAWLEVTVEGSAAPPVRVDTTLVPARPDRVELTADTSKGTLDLTAKALDAAGNGLAGRAVECAAFGAKATGVMKDAGAGTYTQSFQPAVGSAVEVRCQVRSAASENPLRHVVLTPGRRTVRNDGVAEMPVRVATVDAFGLPVPNVEVSLAVEHGGGTMPVTIRTDAQGLAEVAYTSGNLSTAVRIQAEAGRVGGAVAFLQVPDGVRPPEFPLTGAPLAVALDKHWRATSPLLAVGE